MNEQFSIEEVSRIAEHVFEHALEKRNTEHATLITLSGDLGAGKTTLTQSMARHLGVLEKIISPTFIVMKRYTLLDQVYKNLVHIDAYRLEQESELERLHWKELLDNPENLIILEWPERVPKIIPDYAISVSLSHISDEKRHIQID